MRIFGGTADTLLQLAMLPNVDDEQSTLTNQKPLINDAPPLELADAIEAELARGAKSCSEALRSIGARSPELIDRAADFKNSVESQQLTAEARYFAQVREEQAKQPGISRGDAMRLTNRKYPAIRQAYVDEINSRQTPLENRQLSASRNYWARVQEVHKKQSITQAEAMRLVNKKHPSLREDMVRELNS